MNPSLWLQNLAPLQFLRPHWLWALLALPVLAWVWHRRRSRSSVWRSAVDAHLLPHLLDGRDGRRSRFAAATAVFAYALAVLALSGPSWRQSEQPLWQGSTPLVTSSIFMRPTPATTLSTVPTGGVISPIELLMMNSTPK